MRKETPEELPGEEEMYLCCFKEQNIQQLEEKMGN